MVRVVQRLLFWYTPQVNRFQVLVGQAVSELALSVSDLRRQFGSLADARFDAADFRLECRAEGRELREAVMRHVEMQNLRLERLENADAESSNKPNAKKDLAGVIQGLADVRSRMNALDWASTDSSPAPDPVGVIPRRPS